MFSVFHRQVHWKTAEKCDILVNITHLKPYLKSLRTWQTLFPFFTHDKIIHLKQWISGSSGCLSCQIRKVDGNLSAFVLKSLNSSFSYISRLQKGTQNDFKDFAKY